MTPSNAGPARYRRPKMILITGPPGSGKSRLAETLSRRWYLPLVSRDRLKEGRLRTCGKGHDDMPGTTNLEITELFIEMLVTYGEQGVSLIAEAAFQHELWMRVLDRLKQVADPIFLCCSVDPEVAADRVLAREAEAPEHAYYHGRLLEGDEADKAETRRRLIEVIAAYDPPHPDVRSYEIATGGPDYVPDLDTLEAEIFRR